MSITGQIRGQRGANSSGFGWGRFDRLGTGSASSSAGVSPALGWASDVRFLSDNRCREDAGAPCCGQWSDGCPRPSRTWAGRTPAFHASTTTARPIAIQSRRIFGTVRFATDGIETGILSSDRHPASRGTPSFAGSYYLRYGIYLKTGVGFRASTGADRREHPRNIH